MNPVPTTQNDNKTQKRIIGYLTKTLMIKSCQNQYKPAHGNTCENFLALFL